MSAAAQKLRVCTRRRGVGPRRGFTFIEMCLGLALMSMVMGAVAAFALSTSRQWQHAERTQSMALAGEVKVGRLRQVLREARLAGAVREGTKDAMLIWLMDGKGAIPADGKIQVTEIGLLQLGSYEITEGQTRTGVLLYRSSADPGSGEDWSDVFNGAEDDDITATFLQVITAQGRKSEVVAADVTAVTFSVSQQERPVVGFRLTQARGDVTDVREGTAVLQAPLAEP